jgi:hypothetical protein
VTSFSGSLALESAIGKFISKEEQMDQLVNLKRHESTVDENFQHE